MIGWPIIDIHTASDCDLLDSAIAGELLGSREGQTFKLGDVHAIHVGTLNGTCTEVNQAEVVGRFAPL